jgi:myo-inositol-1(or 4)-monophosphatase
MHPLLNIATSAAQKAGEIISRHAEQLENVRFSEKSENDFVSEVDLKCEQVIIDTIHKAHPDHAILAEESGRKNDHAESEYTWIIDPLDGTKNYLHGFPFYSVSIAVQHKDRIIHGVIYDPLRQECYSASKGGGARLNNQRLRVSGQIHLEKSLIGTGFPYRNKSLKTPYLKTFETVFSKASGVRRTGSAALDLAYLAAGRLDGFWEFALSPWDIAAGSLLIKEAGGLVSDFDGGEQYLKKGDVVAGTPKVFKALLQSLKASLVQQS